MLQITADELPRLMQCNGSRLMQSSIPPAASDTKIRDEGIAAHHAATMLFERRINAAELINTKAPNGIFITHEMINHVSDYIDELIIRPDATGTMEVVTSWSSISGRADHIAWYPDISTLYIDDFKYGYGIVEPEQNWTLISHAIGYCERFNINPAKVVLTIHQPRAPHPEGGTRVWEITNIALVQYKWIINGVLSAPTDELNTGPACNKCHALPTCPAAHSARMNAIDCAVMAFDDDLTDERLAYELDLLKLAQSTIDQGLNAREELAKHRIRKGSVVKNYSVKTGLTNRLWKPFVTPELIMALTAVPVTEPAKLATPAEAIRRGISESVVASLTERRPTELKLVRADADKQARRLLGK